MVSKEEFAALRADFVESQEFVDIAHFHRRGMKFVCHHNAYLVAGFLQRKGHESIQWVSGYYECQRPAKPIHHSWIKLDRDGTTVVIFEFDPRQLHERGGYENDLMPSGHVPELSIPISGTACIIDPDLVQLPEEAKESRRVVSSREVMLRYIENVDLVPEIDFANLDQLGEEAHEEFDLIGNSSTKTLRNERGLSRALESKPANGQSQDASGGSTWKLD